MAGKHFKVQFEPHTYHTYRLDDYIFFYFLQLFPLISNEQDFLSHLNVFTVRLKLVQQLRCWHKE